MHAILIRLPKLNAIPLKHELHAFECTCTRGGLWEGRGKFGLSLPLCMRYARYPSSAPIGNMRFGKVYVHVHICAYLYAHADGRRAT